MKEDDEQLVMTVRELREMLREAETHHAFALGDFFTSENIVEIAKSQFPRLEARVAMHREAELTKRQMEQTKRLLIVVAGLCLIAGAALIVFAPIGKEGVSYVVAASLAILSLGAIGVQEFRIRTVGIRIESGAKALE